MPVAQQRVMLTTSIQGSIREHSSHSRSLDCGSVRSLALWNRCQVLLHETIVDLGCYRTALCQQGIHGIVLAHRCYVRIQKLLNEYAKRTVRSHKVETRRVAVASDVGEIFCIQFLATAQLSNNGSFEARYTQGEAQIVQLDPLAKVDRAASRAIQKPEPAKSLITRTPASGAP